MKKLFILLLPLITVIAGCENDIPLRVRDQKPTLVMNSFIDTDSTNNRLFLNFTGIYETQYVTDARIEIHVNGTLVETARPIIPQTVDDIPRHPVPYYLITTRFHPGDRVRIDAYTADKAYHAWTESVVPQPIAIERIDTVSSSSSQYGYDLLQYRVTFTDSPGERNFYRLFFDLNATLRMTSDMTQQDTILTASKQQTIANEDIVLTDGQPQNDNSMFEQSSNIFGVFDDARIAGQRYTMTAYSWKHFYVNYTGGTPKSASFDVVVHLQSIDETTYYYLKALNIIDSDVYDPTLMEPIRYPSNVNGGTGIVSISSGSSRKFHLRDITY